MLSFVFGCKQASFRQPKEVFDAFDENSDGEVDRYEIEKVFRSIDPTVTKQDVNLMVHFCVFLLCFYESLKL